MNIPMHLKTRIRTLAGAALVALAVAGIAVTAASAEMKGGTNDPNCAATGATLYPPSSLDWEFFPPGEVVVMKDPNGILHNMRCGSGGVWTEFFRLNPSRGRHGGVIVYDTPGGRRR